MNELEAQVRLAVYRWLIDHGRAPAPAEMGAQLGLLPHEVIAIWRRLQEEHDALVLLPGSEYLWMAEPFSAVPTGYVAETDDGRWWFGNCAWDALGILAVMGVDGQMRTTCKASGDELVVRVDGDVVSAPAEYTVHFAVPARDWWKSIGFT